MSKRMKAASMFTRSGMGFVMLRLRSLLAREVRIQTYHRVVEVARAYDPANVSASPEEFEKQLRYYKKNFDLLRFSDLQDIEEGSLRCPRRPLLITFDDGFSDNFHNAFPILRSHDVSAAFFVTTHHIGSNELFWFDKVGYLLKFTEVPEWRFSDDTVMDLSAAARPLALKKALEYLKTLPTERCLEEIASLEVQSSDAMKQAIDEINLPMSWAQVEEMHEHGMEILSHSHTHPVLSRLGSEEEIDHELSISKEMIENSLRTTCNTIAYPVGRYFAYDERVLESVRKCGYKYACVNESGLNAFPFERPFELKRVSVDNFHSLQSLAGMTVWPELFAY